LQPGHVGALLALASVSQEAKDLLAAERYLKLALEKNPRSVPVYLTLFKFYLTAGRAAEVEPLFQQALKDTNNNIQILQALDGFYEGSNRFEEAEAIVTKIRTLHPKEPAYWGVLADFYVRTGNYAKARMEFERVLKEHKDDVDDLHKLIEVNIDMNDRKTAESLNDALLKKNKEDNYAHLLKGRLALAEGNIELASVEFNKALRFKADWPAAHFWIAQLQIRKGEFQQAKNELEKALQHDPDYRVARLTLAALQNHTGAVLPSMINTMRLLQSNPHDLPALLVYTDSLMIKKDYNRAEKVLKLAEPSAPGSADLHRELGILALARKNVVVARKEFQLAWDLQPTSRLLLEHVENSYVIDNQLSGGIDFLRQAIVGRPKDAVLQLEIARMYLWHGQRPEAVTALLTAMKLEPSNPESDILLADVYAASNQSDQATAVLAAAVRKAGATSELLMLAGMVYERLQRWDDARDTYERSVAMDSSNAIAKNNLASVLVDHGGDLNVALTLAAQAKEMMVDRPEISSTLGWIYYKRQLYPLAYKYLADCASKDQRNPMFQYQLGMTQWKMGNPAEARRLLKKALALDAHFPGAADATSALSQIGPG
jgi:tetratricopeptide (TPR) repeat protein